MRKPIATISLLFFCLNIFSQEVQWASKVNRYSSQYDTKAYSADQVVGKPNKLPGAGQSTVAWAPRSERLRKEYLWVEFDSSMYVQQVLVAENLNPGSIKEIYLYDARNRSHLVYENNRPGPVFMEQRLFHHTFERTDYRVRGCKVIFDISSMPGMIQIDAIGIADHHEKPELKVNEIKDASFEGHPENLGPAINSPFDERLPIISPNGKTIYFARKQHPHNTGNDKADDIWVSQRDPMGFWTPARNIGQPLNTEFHNYVAAISTDGQKLFLANEYNLFGNPSEGMSVSKKNNGQWAKPVNLRIKSFQNLNEFSCYSVGINESVILMAIERADTYGGMDIYVSFREGDNGWSSPKNIGPDINTAGYEGSVFLAADMRTIYFSSEGHPGYGEFDMFMSRRLDNTWTNWSEPVNLGSKINSKGWDVNYTVPASGDYVYFASEKSGQGGTDLFRIKLPRELQPDPVAMMEGKVIDALTSEPLDMKIKYINSKTGEEVYEFDSRERDGEYTVIIPRNPDIIMQTEEPGYFPQSSNMEFEEEDKQYMDYDEKDEKEKLKRDVEEEIRKETNEELEKGEPENEEGLKTLKDRLKRQIEQRIEELINEQGGKDIDEQEKEELKEELKKELEKEVDEKLKETKKEYVEMEQDIEMIPIREGQIIRLDKIYFEANKWYLRSNSHEELTKVIQFMNVNPGVHIEIGGHTNGLPSDAFCDELSENRAKTVAEYLIDHGVAADRVTWKGYGKREPIATNETLAGRRKNQRVEIKIMKVK